MAPNETTPPATPALTPTTTNTTTNPTISTIHRPAHLTHAAALAACAAVEAKSKEIGVPMNIAIVDASLYLLHFTRLPGAKLTSIDIAINKAFTAAGHRVPTSAYKAQVQPGGAAYGLSIAGANGGRFT
ncbi:putative 15.0 kDa protein in dhaT-dhaS intergenic region, partial [Cyphellophora attinorum]